MTTTGPRKTAAAPRKPRQVSTVTRTAQTVEKPVEAVSEPSEKILIHFVADGLTAFGCVWLTGQELEVEKASDHYQSWMELSEEEQIERWGSVKFRPGPSSIPNSIINYRVMTGDGVDLAGRPKYQGYMAKQEREKAAQAEKARGRSVPKV